MEQGTEHLKLNGLIVTQREQEEWARDFHEWLKQRGEAFLGLIERQPWEQGD